MATEVSQVTPEPGTRAAQYGLVDALLARRSRRFGRGMHLNGGPLAYASTQAAQPLSLAEEAALAIAATIACCEYLYRRYGRIPPGNGPFRTLMGYQAHHLDAEFYEKFYRPEAVGAIA